MAMRGFAVESVIGLSAAIVYDERRGCTDLVMPQFIRTIQEKR